MIPSLAPILDHVGPFLMVLFRLSGVLVFAPIVSSATVPVKIRLFICLCLALAVYPTLPAEQMKPIAIDLFTLTPLLIGEVLIGVAIGLLGAVPLYMVQLAGLVMGQQAGMSLATIFNPAIESESDVFGQFLLYMAMVVFISLGGLETLFLSCARTFQGVPIGSVLGSGVATISPLELLGSMCSSGFELALRVSSPILCIILIETIVSALVMKTMPQLNIMSIGFAVKIVLTLVALTAAAATISQVVGEHVTISLESIARFTQELGR
jgi:flagellar biosynthetic protein FliR